MKKNLIVNQTDLVKSKTKNNKQNERDSIIRSFDFFLYYCMFFVVVLFLFRSSYLILSLTHSFIQPLLDSFFRILLPFRVFLFLLQILIEVDKAWKIWVSLYWFFIIIILFLIRINSASFQIIIWWLNCTYSLFVCTAALAVSGLADLFFLISFFLLVLVWELKIFISLSFLLNQ